LLAKRKKTSFTPAFVYIAGVSGLWRCKGALQRGSAKGRCKGALQRGAAKGRCKGALQRVVRGGEVLTIPKEMAEEDYDCLTVCSGGEAGGATSRETKNL
jgi:hypothetical protein